MSDTDSTPIDPGTAAQLDAADSNEQVLGEGGAPGPDEFSAVIEEDAEQRTDPETGMVPDPDDVTAGQES